MVIAGISCRIDIPVFPFRYLLKHERIRVKIVLPKYTEEIDVSKKSSKRRILKGVIVFSKEGDIGLGKVKNIFYMIFKKGFSFYIICGSMGR